MSPLSPRTWSNVAPWARNRVQSAHEPSRHSQNSEGLSPRQDRSGPSATGATSPSSLRDTSSALSGAFARQTPRKPSRLRSLIRRRGDDRTTSEDVSETQYSYVPYAPPEQPVSAQRSAPSLMTSWPTGQRRTSTNMPSLQRQRPYSQQYVSPISPPDFSASAGAVPYDPWENAILGQPAYPSQALAAFTRSPVPYSPVADQAPDVSPLSPIRQDAAPINAHHSGPNWSYPPTNWHSPLGNVAHELATNSSRRRADSDAAVAIASPSEYALFVAATSSLSIVADEESSSQNSECSRGIPRARPQLTAPRIDAPGSDPLHFPGHSSLQTTAPGHHTDVPPFRMRSAYSTSRAALQAPQPQQRSSSQGPCQSSFTARPLSLVPVTVGSPERSRPGSRSQMIADALLGLEPDRYASEEADDELPDYATSQREASARRRWEAAQRARELDEAWRRGKRRRTGLEQR